MLWFESPSQWWIPSKIGVLNSSSLPSSLNPSQLRTPSYCKVRLCPSPRIHSGLKEQLVQLLEQARYWTTNIWLNSLPHPEMRGKVDLTRILDLIFNPTPVNDAMGKVFLLSFFHQCWPSRGSSMPNPNGQTNLRSAPSSIIHPPSPVPESPPLLGLALFLNSSLKFSGFHRWRTPALIRQRSGESMPWMNQ